MKKFKIAANVGLLTIALLTTWTNSRPTKQSILNGRAPASLPESRAVTKAGTAFQTEIVELAKTADGDGFLVDLKANITARKSLSGVKFAWNLPAGAQVVSGSAQGDLGTLAADSATQTSITVRVPGDFNRRIHIHVYHNVHGEAYGQVAQYNTLNQKAIDESVQSKAAILGDTEDGQAAFKIIQ